MQNGEPSMASGCGAGGLCRPASTVAQSAPWVSLPKGAGGKHQTWCHTLTPITGFHGLFCSMAQRHSPVLAICFTLWCLSLSTAGLVVLPHTVQFVEQEDPQLKPHALWESQAAEDKWYGDVAAFWDDRAAAVGNMIEEGPSRNSVPDLQESLEFLQEFFPQVSLWAYSAYRPTCRLRPAEGGRLKTKHAVRHPFRYSGVRDGGAGRSPAAQKHSTPLKAQDVP